jgi:hypothetical protein
MLTDPVAPEPDPIDARPRPLKVLFVLEVDLTVTSPADASSQVQALARKLRRFQETKFRLCRALRIAVDEPDPRRVQAASSILGYLDQQDLANDPRVQQLAAIEDTAQCEHGVTARQLRAGARCLRCDPFTLSEIENPDEGVEP